MKATLLSLALTLFLTRVLGAAVADNADLARKIETIKRAPSNGIADIAKMMEQGVDASVIQSYVENSTVPYNPTSDDILYLHERGVGSQIITAVIRHGNELRQEQAKTYREQQNRMAAATTPVASATSSQVAATGPTVISQPPGSYSYYYSYPQPVYIPATYPVYSYSYALPSYSLYSYYAYRPFYSYYGCGPYRSSFPRVSFGVGFGNRHHSPHVTIGASFGRGHHAFARVR